MTTGRSRRTAPLTFRSNLTRVRNQVTFDPPNGATLMSPRLSRRPRFVGSDGSTISATSALQFLAVSSSLLHINAAIQNTPCSAPPRRTGLNVTGNVSLLAPPTSSLTSGFSPAAIRPPHVTGRSVSAARCFLSFCNSFAPAITAGSPSSLTPGLSGASQCRRGGRVPFGNDPSLSGSTSLAGHRSNRLSKGHYSARRIRRCRALRPPIVITPVTAIYIGKGRAMKCGRSEISARRRGQNRVTIFGGPLRH